MTKRFPGLVLPDWRARLVHDHPRLFPDTRVVLTADGPALAASGWPCIPDGWRSVLETACRRMGAAIEAEPAAELAVLDMDEKWGQLRLSVSSIGLSGDARDAVELAVSLAEARSAHVCAICGEPGRLMKAGTWLAVRCGAHSDGHAPVRSRDSDLEIVTRFSDGEAVRSARRYDPALDAFVPACLPPEDEE